MPHLTSHAAVVQTRPAHILMEAADLDTLCLVSQVLDVGAHGEEAT